MYSFKIWRCSSSATFPLSTHSQSRNYKYNNNNRCRCYSSTSLRLRKPDQLVNVNYKNNNTNESQKVRISRLNGSEGQNLSSTVLESTSFRSTIICQATEIGDSSSDDSNENVNTDSVNDSSNANICSICDGSGRVMGGIGAVPGFGWWPIKAYRPCPECSREGRRYKRSGQTLDEVLFGRK